MTCYPVGSLTSTIIPLVLFCFVWCDDRQGGANGSIRFDPEMQHGANAGLPLAMALLKPVKAKFPEVGWADLMQMASATAVEVAGESLICDTGRVVQSSRHAAVGESTYYFGVWFDSKMKCVLL